MKTRLIIGLLALALALGGIGAGASAGTHLPAGGQLVGGTTAEAASFNVEAVAPRTSIGAGFTYQGRLKDGSNPANGPYDFQFTLYDAMTGGTLVAGPLDQPNQTVSEGLFTVLLDFGAGTFTGAARTLQIAVRPSGGGGYTTLLPRQALTPAPYALYALKTKGYKNMVVVSPDGGDFTSVQAALTSITDNSATNKYLVWVGPGTYTEQVTMKSWVDLEGAGEQVTRITFTGSPSTASGTVVGASNAALRSLTVENTGGSAYATALYNNGASPSVLQVSLMASGGTSSNYGVHNVAAASPTLTNVTATASGAASNNFAVNDFNASSPMMTNVTLAASGGSLNFGVYNTTAAAPIMNSVTVIASGGSENIGVFNSSSAPAMTNVTLTASGGSFANYGVYNTGAASSTMTNVTVTASGAAPNNYGVYNDASSFSITNGTFTAAAGTNNYGVHIFGAGTHTINNSVITGSTATIDSSAQVGASKLNGGPAGGTVTCAGVYDENYTFFVSTCP